MKTLTLNIERLDSKKMLSGLDLIHTNLAWNITRGSKDVVVAVIDTGIDINHSLLKDNIWVNTGEIPNNGIDDEGDGYIDDVNGWNFNNNTNNVQDGYGHGTHVAGIVHQVAPDVTIMPLKFTDDRGVGYTGAAASAMQYIVMMKTTYHVNVVVVNSSWGGGTGFSNMLYAEIKNLNSANIVLTAGAGNSGRDMDVTPAYPACFDVNNVISVGALTSDGSRLASFSNYGKNSLDLASPGSAIYSTLPYNRYGYKSGTSMATPFVAGTVALMKSANPELTISSIRNNLLSSVNGLGTLVDKTVSGGYLDTNNAVRLSIGLDKTIYPPPVVTYPPSVFNVNINKVIGIIKKPSASEIVVTINGKEVKRFEATGQFTEPLRRRYFRRGWNNVDVYENGVLMLHKRVRRIV